MYKRQGWYVDHDGKSKELQILKAQQETVTNLARLRSRLYSHSNVAFASSEGLEHVKLLNRNQLIYDIMQLADFESKFAEKRPNFPSEEQTSTESLVSRSLKVLGVENGLQFVKIAGGVFDKDFYPYLHASTDPANRHLIDYVDRCLDSNDST